MRTCSTLMLAGMFLPAALFGQYTASPAGEPPADLAAPVRAALQKTGTKVSGNGITAELWLCSAAPSGPKSSEADVTLPNIPQGALVGALRVDGKFTDRRGQGIKPGSYTLRYSNYPVTGDHQGVAPQRDFLLLVPASADSDAAATPAFQALVGMSKKASGTPHAAVLSFWKADSDAKAGLSQSGETDWVLTTKLGDTTVSVILFGTAGS
jgi:hypothetical protein